MKKFFWFSVLTLAVVVGGFYILNGYIYNAKQAKWPADYKDAEYVIEGRTIKLAGGSSEIESEDGYKIATAYFGNELRKDLDGDGREDVVFLATQNTGGTGTFFYVLAAINTGSGYRGSHGTFIGDRIAPQNTQSGEGRIVVVNYADRASGEPFTAEPSVGKSLYLLFDSESMQFGEVVKDFEGEADPSRMTLGMKTWVWTRAELEKDSIVTPRQSGAFTLKFLSLGKFSVSTDCNGGGGDYAVKDDSLSFKSIFATEMYCQGSQDSDFFGFLSETESYRFTSRGELVLILKDGRGEMFFR